MKMHSLIRFCKPRSLLPLMLITVLLGNLLSLHAAVQTVPMTALPGADRYAGLRPTTSLTDFLGSVVNGESDTLVGVYIPGLLALPVGQQPKGNAGYVTREPHKTTQFRLASKYGTIGILAHNDLAGAQFSGIRQNQYAIVIYGDGRLEYFLFGEVQKYQALTPTSTYSDFINQDGSEERLTASQLFNRIYGQGERLVFQTCIAADGNPSWGRMFIIARPANRSVLSVIQQTSFVLEVSSFGLAAR
jgi:hypothetical protein